jgi:hypothetical protein
MKALSLAIPKIWPMLKFLKSGSNFKVKVTRSKILVPIKGLVIRNTHMKYESPITCHSRDMANVKVFADRQTNRQTGQKLYAPDLSIRGHKNFIPNMTVDWFFICFCEC